MRTESVLRLIGPALLVALCCGAATATDALPSDSTSPLPVIETAAPPAAPAAAAESRALQAPPPSEQDATARGIAAAGKPLKLGAEIYAGGSNLSGSRLSNDGFWAGSATILPSVAYARWENGKGHAAKLALGLGDTFRGRDRIYDQPAEAWWQAPAGKASLTIGQYWVPFALQEWEYENKPGMMLQWSGGRHALALSANQNTDTGHANIYLRASHDFGSENAVGLSLAAGKGLSFDSDHDRGWALDGTYGVGGWRLTAEHIRLRTPGSGKFRFNWVRLAYEDLGAWKPFISRYDWKDDTDALGTFHSTVLGLSYRVHANLAVEAALAATSDSDVAWLQFHWSWER